MIEDEILEGRSGGALDQTDEKVDPQEFVEVCGRCRLVFSGDSFEESVCEGRPTLQIGCGGACDGSSCSD